MSQSARHNPETRSSLLLRVKRHDDDEAWREFHDLYSPLIFAYARARGLQEADADDVRADCLAALVKQIPAFEYEKSRGGFRAWLRTMVVRRVIDRARRRHPQGLDAGTLSELQDDSPDQDEVWNRTWRQQHLAFCMEQVRPLVGVQTWEIFESLLQERETVSELQNRLQITANQIYKARARVLELIRSRMQFVEG